ncbi:MAG: hypothetical protein AAGC99_05560 [Pseudomonadota bacterium]
MLDLARRRSTARCDFVGLRVDIYRPAGCDTTAGGVSADHDQMTIYPEAAVARAGDDVLVLVPHRLGLRAVPYRLWAAGRWVMVGGHFCFTSDSRFPSDQPIKIFDRVEGADA